MVITKTSELLKLLEENGTHFLKHGKRHEIYYSEKTKMQIPIPRHAKEVPVGTAERILKDAGIK